MKMTDTMMIVFGVLLVILALYIAVVIILGVIIFSSNTYRVWYEGFKKMELDRIAKYREGKDE
jgi:hypothetical protein